LKSLLKLTTLTLVFNFHRKKKGLQAKNNQLQQTQKTHQPSAEEEAKRLRRLRRFEEDAAQFKADNVSTPLQQMHIVR
jgi:hypothetical protein